MGATESVGSEYYDPVGSGVHKRKIFASNTGNCMEERRDDSIDLHLGSGKINWQDWINCDLDHPNADQHCDIRKLPFGTDYADRICAVHVVEHFYHWELQKMLKEWLRVLKPGGKLIIELPCMDKVFAYIADKVTRKLPVSPTFTFFPIWGDPNYHSEAMCHKWGYTMAMMKEELRLAGFNEIAYLKARYHFPERDMRLEAIK